MPNVELRLGTCVTGLAHDARGARVTAQGAERQVFDYGIGCGGGRSTVRKCLDIEFEGYTWPERFLVLTTLFDFQTALGCRPRGDISDPEEGPTPFKCMGGAAQG